MIGRVFVAILALVILFGFSSVITQGIHGIRTETVIQVEEDVVTDPAETTTDVILTSALFNDSITQVDSITSTISETPIASEYDSGTQTLTVSNLDDDNTRTLTITYFTEMEDQYMGIIGPFLTFLIFGGIIFALIWGVWKRH